MSDGEKDAFPTTAETFAGSGLSKREYFAAMALQSAITLPWAQGNPNQAAVTAVSFADCLIRALAKPTSSGDEKHG
jgi:hypothetical protein